MEYTENYNLKKPDMNDTASISDINENMDIIDQKLKEAGQSEQLQSDVTEIKTDIGSPSDISSSPTIFGKLAEIKETLTTKFSEIISKITSIDSKIGTTTDTGGTSSAGGIFAKLNKLLTDWTTTRASRIDTIYTNTNTSTTSSSTGTLCQRLNYIRALIGASSDSGTDTIFGLLKGLLSKGIVKSVQRGEYNTTLESDLDYEDLTINTININKSILLVTASNSTGNNSYVQAANGKILNSNTIRIYRTGYSVVNSTNNYHNTNWQVIEFY